MYKMRILAALLDLRKNLLKLFKQDTLLSLTLSIYLQKIINIKCIHIDVSSLFVRYIVLAHKLHVSREILKQNEEILRTYFSNCTVYFNLYQICILYFKFSAL